MVREVVGNRGLMQTFLPFADFEMSARSLDTKRLGKQRVECIQVVRGLVRPGYGWRHHPAVKMWCGHEEALGRYGLTCCDVWLERGLVDTCSAAGALPPWLGHEDFHRSHRASLLRKDPDSYRDRFPDVPDDLDYVWPGGRRPEGVAAASGRVLPGTASCTGALADAGMTADQSIRQPPRMPK